MDRNGDGILDRDVLMKATIPHPDSDMDEERKKWAASVYERIFALSKIMLGEADAVFSEQLAREVVRRSSL